MPSLNSQDLMSKVLGIIVHQFHRATEAYVELHVRYAPLLAEENGLLVQYFADLDVAADDREQARRCMERPL